MGGYGQLIWSLLLTPDKRAAEQVSLIMRVPKRTLPLSFGFRVLGFRVDEDPNLESHRSD